MLLAGLGLLSHRNGNYLSVNGINYIFTAEYPVKDGADIHVPLGNGNLAVDVDGAGLHGERIAIVLLEAFHDFQDGDVAGPQRYVLRRQGKGDAGYQEPHQGGSGPFQWNLVSHIWFDYFKDSISPFSVFFMRIAGLRAVIILSSGSSLTKEAK